jgi:enterochelin esterase-like enzyme
MKTLLILFSLGVFVIYCNQTLNNKNVKEKIVSKNISNQNLIYSHIFSKNLKRNWNFLIYLPPNYQFDTLSKHSVLYLLHGHVGNHETWMGSGEIKSMIDELIISNKIKSFIIVMPDGGNSWFVDGKEKMESAIIRDLLPYINKKYRVNTDWKAMSIGGMSAGGYGSLRLIMKYPDIFSNAILMSPACYFPFPDKTSYSRSEVSSFRDLNGTFSSKRWTNYNYPNYWKIFKKSRHHSHHFYLSVGKSDGYTGIIKAVNEQLPSEFSKREIQFEVQNYEGGHEMNVWKQALKKAILTIYKK